VSSKVSTIVCLGMESVNDYSNMKLNGSIKEWWSFSLLSPGSPPMHRWNQAIRRQDIEDSNTSRAPEDTNINMTDLP